MPHPCGRLSVFLWDISFGGLTGSSICAVIVVWLSSCCNWKRLFSETSVKVFVQACHLVLTHCFTSSQMFSPHDIHDVYAEPCRRRVKNHWLRKKKKPLLFPTFHKLQDIVINLLSNYFPLLWQKHYFRSKIKCSLLASAQHRVGPLWNGHKTRRSSHLCKKIKTKTKKHTNTLQLHYS